MTAPTDPRRAAAAAKAAAPSGASTAAAGVSAAAGGRTALLALHGLTRRYGALAAADDVSLAVDAGSVHALIGPNGAGKTTLIGLIGGQLRADAGRIEFDGDDLTRLPPHARVRRGLARSWQVTNLFGRLSALDNAALAVQAASGGSFRIWHPVRHERALFERAAAVLDRVGLGARHDVPAGVLAHGEQRRLEVALALASRPRLLLLDEPMAGMGPDESAQMVALLQSLRGEVTLLLVEHDMDAVFRLADTISVLVYGHLIASGAPDAIRAHHEVRRAYLGDAAESAA